MQIINNIKEKFCSLLQEKKFDEASLFIEDVAKKLVEEKVPSSPLRRMRDLVVSLKGEVSSVDRVYIRSELLGLRLEPISGTIANLCLTLSGSDLEKLIKIVQSLENFFRFYSGGE
ncbi:MAG: hypothetical protein QXH03_09475 [Candidatus Bathyarchaeia archaeon]